MLHEQRCQAFMNSGSFVGQLVVLGFQASSALRDHPSLSLYCRGVTAASQLPHWEHVTLSSSNKLKSESTWQRNNFLFPITASPGCTGTLRCPQHWAVEWQGHQENDLRYPQVGCKASTGEPYLWSRWIRRLSQAIQRQRSNIFAASNWIF